MTDDYHREYPSVDLDVQNVCRGVPFSARLAVRLANPWSLVGWGVFGFAMIFGWMVLAAADLTFGVRFAGALDTAQGTVTEVKQTTMSENESKIHAVHYRFPSPDGQVRQGVSYTFDPPEAGTAVSVEFPEGDPETSRIAGMRTKPFGGWLAVFLLLPLVGWVLVMVGWSKGGKNLRLLRTGVLTRGRLVDKQPTASRVNNRRVWKLTFGFTDAEGNEHQAVARTHTPEKLTDQPEELVLYDPAAPYRSTLLDVLPGGVGIDPRRNEVSRPSLLRIVLPVGLVSLVILGHGLYLLNRLTP